MKGFAQRAAGSEDQHRALRLHLRKYRITAHQRRVLANVLASLDDLTQGLLIALDETGAGECSNATLQHFKLATRLLVDGESGEFR